MRSLLKRWREKPIISFVLSRMIRPLYLLSRYIVQRVPWTIRVNGGVIDYEDAMLKFPHNCGISFCTLLWWEGVSGYEPASWSVMRACIDKADYFWDVGSNVGMYAVLAKKVRPDIQVQAFEPVPSLAESNRRLQRANNVDINLNNAAVSDNSNGAEIAVRKYAHLIEVEPTASLAEGVNLAEGADLEMVKVPTVTLDDLASLLPDSASIFIKVDVEGHEDCVLKGGRSMIAKYRPLILCEILPNVARHNEIAKELIAANYDIFAICREGLFRIAPDDLQQPRTYTDYLLMPHEKTLNDRSYYSFKDLPV